MALNKSQIEALRRDYRASSLEVEQMSLHPQTQFGKWFEEAMQSEVPEPNVMTLATCSAAGKPSARIILLKGFDEQGFMFYTNYESKKGKELEENPNAALVFCWLELERQVRIEGTIEKLSREESARYFYSRPKGSQIGAWASEQSEVIADRKILEDRVAVLQKKYADQEQVPLPPFWGGYLLRATLVEFWQGRSNRLHDRMRYSLNQDGAWKIDRLSP